MKIIRESNISDKRLEELNVDDWSLWSKQSSKFKWSYNDTETCYILEGEFTVHLPGNSSISAKTSDLIQFPKGLHCEWEIKSDVKKRYTMGNQIKMNQETGKVTSIKE